MNLVSTKACLMKNFRGKRGALRCKVSSLDFTPEFEGYRMKLGDGLNMVTGKGLGGDSQTGSRWLRCV